MSVKTNQDLWQNYNLNVRQILWERLLCILQKYVNFEHPPHGSPAHQPLNNIKKFRHGMTCSDRWLRLFSSVCLALTNTWLRRWQHGCGCWKWVRPWNHRSQSGTSELPPCQQRTADPLLWGRWRSQPYPAAPLCPKRKGGRSREQKILYSLLYV